METENIIFFEISTQEYENIFDHTFQEGSKLKLLNINIILGKYVISTDQAYQIKKSIIQ